MTKPEDLKSVVIFLLAVALCDAHSHTPQSPDPMTWGRLVTHHSHFLCRLVAKSSCSTLLWPSQAPLSMGFPRPEHWSVLPFLSPGDLPDPGIEPAPLTLIGRLSTIEPPGKPLLALGSVLFLSISVPRGLYFFLADTKSSLGQSH